MVNGLSTQSCRLYVPCAKYCCFNAAVSCASMTSCRLIGCPLAGFHRLSVNHAITAPHGRTPSNLGLEEAMLWMLRPWLLRPSCAGPQLQEMHEHNEGDKFALFASVTDFCIKMCTFSLPVQTFGTASQTRLILAPSSLQHEFQY